MERLPSNLSTATTSGDLLKEYELGVRSTLRTVEDADVDHEFYADV